MNLSICLISALILIQSMAASLARAEGPITSGGGNVVNGKAVEEYRTSLDQLTGFNRAKEELVRRLSLCYSNIEESLNVELSKKAVYQIPVEFEQLPAQVTGLWFKSGQCATHDGRELFFSEPCLATLSLGSRNWHFKHELLMSLVPDKIRATPAAHQAVRAATDVASGREFSCEALNQAAGGKIDFSERRVEQPRSSDESIAAMTVTGGVLGAIAPVPVLNALDNRRSGELSQQWTRLAQQGEERMKQIEAEVLNSLAEPARLSQVEALNAERARLVAQQEANFAEIKKLTKDYGPQYPKIQEVKARNQNVEREMAELSKRLEILDSPQRKKEFYSLAMGMEFTPVTLSAEDIEAAKRFHSRVPALKAEALQIANQLEGIRLRRGNAVGLPGSPYDRLPVPTRDFGGGMRTGQWVTKEEITPVLPAGRNVGLLAAKVAVPVMALSSLATGGVSYYAAKALTDAKAKEAQRIREVLEQEEGARAGVAE